MEVENIFDTENRGGVLWNFRRFVDLEISKLDFSQDFHEGKDLLLGAVHAAGVNRKRLEEACRCFLNAAGQSKDPDVKLFAYLGAITCYYVLDDLDAIDRLIKEKVKDLKPKSNYLARLNSTGLGQNMLKGLGVAAGGVLSFVPQTKMAGYALMQWASRMQAEDVLEPDYDNSDFYRIQAKITEVEYEKLHRKLKG